MLIFTLLFQISSGIENSFKNLPVNPVTPEAMRSFVILPLWKGFTDAKNAPLFQAPYLKAVLNLNVASTVLLSKFFHLKSSIILIESWIKGNNLLLQFFHREMVAQPSHRISSAVSEQL